jgi:citrate lyase subunit beta/citryl-CoA lyase
MIFLDLEDSVAPSVKEAARRQAVSALREHEFAGKVRAVRVNAVDSPWCLDDLRCLVEGAGDRIDTVVLPKVEDVDEVHFVHHALAQLETRRGLERRIGIEVQIESAGALERVDRIAGASPRIEALVLGPVDLAASLRAPGVLAGGPDGPATGFWEFVLCRILVAARAHGLQAIDGPHPTIADLDGLRVLAARSARLGYDGKWAVHPSQVDTLNQAFTPALDEVARAREIVRVYSEATREGARGAVMLGDEMIDEATRRAAEVTVELGRSLGLDRPRDGEGSS